MRFLEEHLQRPLQWVICLLHFNELPFKHLFQTIDGRATGPEKLTGPIGKKLNDCEKTKIAAFPRIPVSHSLPITNRADLSHDQQYLFDCFEAVKSGVCSVKLANSSPGKLNLSRWVTTASRILRFYMSQDSPSTNLRLIATYIMNVYIPFWFDVKTKKSIKDGAIHFYSFIKRTRYLEKKYLNIIEPVIARNAYFAHPENVLLSMLSDSRPEIRTQAVEKIVQARNNERHSSVRKFRVPTLNFQADDYTKMINLNSSNVTPPPVLSNVSSEDLFRSLNEDKWEFFGYPNNTQAVERTVKLVTAASESVCGYTARDGFIRATLKSRKNLPKNDNKQHLKNMVIPMDIDE